MSRLEELLARWEAGEISATEMAELKRLLASPGGRAELVDEWRLTEAIYDALHTRRATAPVVAPNAAGARADAAVFTRPMKPRRFRWLVWREFHLSLGRSAAFGAAACLAVAGIWFYFQKAAAARLGDARGGVVITRRGQTLPASTGALLYPGDEVGVPRAGAATVVWPGEDSALTLSGGAKLALFNPLLGKKLALRRGALEAVAAPQPGLRPMTIATPEAEARVVGTRFSLTVTGAASRLQVLQGAVRFRKTRPTVLDRQPAVVVGAGHAATAAADVPLAVGWVTGALSVDDWAAPAGTPLSDAPAIGTPLAPPAAATAAAGSNIVERLRGYLLAPATGDFVFWVASHGGDAPVELWLSPDEDPARKQRIAYETPVAGRPAARGNPSLQIDFHRSPTQQSASQPLVRGRRYYIEVWHAGLNLDTVGIGWRQPGQSATTPPEPVDLNAFCPYVEPAASAAKKRGFP